MLIIKVYVWGTDEGVEGVEGDRRGGAAKAPALRQQRLSKPPAVARAGTLSTNTHTNKIKPSNNTRFELNLNPSSLARDSNLNVREGLCSKFPGVFF